MHRELGKRKGEQVPRGEGKPNGRFNLKCHLLQRKRKIINQLIITNIEIHSKTEVYIKNKIILRTF
jgi:hypothetical protein